MNNPAYPPDDLELCPCGEKQVIRYEDFRQWTLNGVESHQMLVGVSYECPSCKRSLKRKKEPSA